MKTSAINYFVTFSSGFEGVFTWPYLDIKGLVTTGIGDLIDPAQYALSIPFARADGTPASQSEIAAAWMAVKSVSCWAEHARPAGMPDHKCPWEGTNRPCLAHWGAGAAKSYTSIRLTDEGVQHVVLRKAAAMEERLRERFPTWDAWPADAQLATMSVSWACGENFNFPALAAAMNAHDFARAAATCTINAAQNPGIPRRNAANRILYRNAACVMRMEAAAADELFYPRELWPDVSTPIGLQRALTMLGFPVGAIDGVVGAKTNAALEEFRISRGIDDDVARATVLARLDQDVVAGVTAREAPTQPDLGAVLEDDEGAARHDATGEAATDAALEELTPKGE